MKEPTEIKAQVERILYSNDSGLIAAGVMDLLIQTREPGAFEEAVDLLYPHLDHCEAGKAQYVAEREAVLGEDAALAQAIAEGLESGPVSSDEVKRQIAV